MGANPTSPNDPAFPAVAEAWPGMTARVYVATAILAAQIAHEGPPAVRYESEWAVDAVRLADTLLIEANGA